VAGLTRADVEHVAFLARLRLTVAELDRLEGQLNHILDQYAKLAELDTSAIPPTAQTIELENILREDIAGPSLSVEQVIGNASAPYINSLAQQNASLTQSFAIGHPSEPNYLELWSGSNPASKRSPISAKYCPMQ